MNGYEFRFEGDEGPGMLPGEVFISLSQKPHSVFERAGADLVMQKSITLQDALCGFHFRAKFLDGADLFVRSENGQVVKPNDIWKVHYPLLNTSYLQPPTYYLQPTAATSLPTSYNRPPTAYYPKPTSYSLQQTTATYQPIYLLPTADDYCLLLRTTTYYYLLPPTTTYYYLLLPNTNYYCLLQPNTAPLPTTARCYLLPTNSNLQLPGTYC